MKIANNLLWNPKIAQTGIHTIQEMYDVQQNRFYDFEYIQGIASEGTFLNYLQIMLQQSHINGK